MMEMSTFGPIFSALIEARSMAAKTKQYHKPVQDSISEIIRLRGGFAARFIFDRTT